ncbi:MAG: type II toxin-antitoxin system Phd/YefM family antitoxin [Gemmatimonadota bacterium]
MTSWNLESAKNRFSELVRRAESEGPQLVTKHGREAAVVLGVEEYRRLTQPGDLLDFLAASPFASALREGELLLTRSPDLSRDPLL